MHFSKRRVAAMRENFVRDRINDIDLQFGRKLGCRISERLREFLDPDNHLRKKTKPASEHGSGNREGDGL